MPLLLKIYPHRLAQCLARGLHPAEMCSVNTYTLQAAYFKEAGRDLDFKAGPGPHVIYKYDPVAIYFIVLGSSLYTLFVFPV